ncbi:uncharacterized protein LOC110829371 isoform X2 [Zootermopsis nevadensis]|nr:uncharacterized protein LOC110829371 isoform X2 [Zootermopsis nevadensis]
MFARLCQHHVTGGVKRRHSWSSDSDFQLPERSLDSEGEQSPSTWYIQELNGVWLAVPDLVGPCRDLDAVADLSGSAGEEEEDDEDEEEEEEEEEDMGQRSSSLLAARTRPKISLTWVLRGDRQSSSAATTNTAPGVDTSPSAATDAPPPTSTTISTNNNTIENPVTKCNAKPNDCINNKVSSEESKNNNKSVGAITTRTSSEPSLLTANSESGRSGRSHRDKNRHRRNRIPRHKTEKQRRHCRFGYEIQDVDAFLTKASLEKPANIPVVLAFPCVLYQTRIGGYQEEFSLPLGMVVNAVFKNQAWLYVQTPHGEEGYVSYAVCLPLGILPPPQRASKPPPCWETHTDIFPQPLGNRTDSEKIREGTRSECGGRGRCYSHVGRRGRYGGERDAVSACGERSVDRLYLRAAASAKCKGTTRHTLLVIRSDYNSKGRNTLSVAKGDVVALVSGHLKDWFWVRSRDGSEGFIPSVVAGHGFL